MLNVRFVMLLLAALSPLGLPLGTSAKTANAEIIDLDTTGVDPQFENAFRRAEAFWDARILGYSNTLPRDVQAQLTGRLIIVASTADVLGGDGNILGQAGPTFIQQAVRGNSFRGRSITVATMAIMQFQNDFLAGSTEDDITDVIIHEMGHALGFGSLWEFNGLLTNFGGTLQYTGVNARRTFAEEIGAVRGITGFVPIEQDGGAGTALSHWDDDSTFFNSQAVDNRVELLTGFFIPNTERFISRTTLASMVDLHYVVAGFNENELLNLPGQGFGGNGFPKPGINTDDPFGIFDPFGTGDDDDVVPPFGVFVPNNEVFNRFRRGSRRI